MSPSATWTASVRRSQRYAEENSSGLICLGEEPAIAAIELRVVLDRTPGWSGRHPGCLPEGGAAPQASLMPTSGRTCR
jgi:hypothetical protein